MKDKIDEGLKKIKKLKEDLDKKGGEILKSKEVQKLKKNIQATGDNLLKREEVQKLKKNFQSAGEKISKDKNLNFLTKIPKKAFIIVGGFLVLLFFFSGDSYENIYSCETNLTEYINLEINLQSGEENVTHYGVKEFPIELDILDNNSNYIKLRDNILGYNYTFFKGTNNLVLNMPGVADWSYNCVIK